MQIIAYKCKILLLLVQLFYIRSGHWMHFATREGKGLEGIGAFMFIRRIKYRTLILITIISTISATPILAQQAEAVEDHIKALIEELTLEEKVRMLHATSSFTSGGVERLDIPELVMTDGPHGIRMEHGRDWEVDEEVDDEATYLPTGIALASTWNPELGYAFGQVLGSEARERGKDVILGPAINLHRTPLNGRNFEYMSEDPFLISRMVVPYIRGVQDQDVAACVKHYIANNQEIERGSINVEMNERALREIYLPGFKAAVQQGGVLSVMGAYNKFRGQYCTHHEYLINDVLKDEYGFKGVLLSDWGAVHSTVEALKYGTDIEMGTDLDMMPEPDYGDFFLGDTVVSLIEDGAFPEELIDEKVMRILRLMHGINIFSDDRVEGERDTKEHHAVVREIAEESIVLLKNDGILPLAADGINSIAVIGANADREFGKRGGSAQVAASYEVTPLEGLQNLVGDDIELNHVPGYTVERGAAADPEQIEAAVEAAEEADLVIYVGGWIHGFSSAWKDNAYDAESVDKPSMYLPFGQDELITALLDANANTVMVLMGGGPTDMRRWIDESRAIVQAWYPGAEGGNALADILFGEVNPSGKLPMTFPKKLDDAPSHAVGEYPGEFGIVHYFEGIFNGYRYYDTFDVEPLFAFGHGLSYTSFEYSDLDITSGEQSVMVRFDVTNAGDRAGKEVVQLYVQDVESTLRRPAKELKAFAKVDLEPGDNQTVEFELSSDAFTYYDDIKRKWVFEPGKFTIHAGSSSRDIRKSATIEL